MRDELKQVLIGISDKQLVLFEHSIDLSEALEKLNELNKDEVYRSRELSLAITNIEQGGLWLAAALANMEDS